MRIEVADVRCGRRARRGPEPADRPAAQGLPAPRDPLELRFPRATLLDDRWACSPTAAGNLTRNEAQTRAWESISRSWLSRPNTHRRPTSTGDREKRQADKEGEHEDGARSSHSRPTRSALERFRPVARTVPLAASRAKAKSRLDGRVKAHHDSNQFAARKNARPEAQYIAVAKLPVKF